MLHLHIDGPGRPPPALSRADATRLRHRLREQSAGHLDADERAELFVAVDLEVDARQLFRADAHAACGLPPGSLDDCSLSTDQVRGALAVLSGLLTP